MIGIPRLALAIQLVLAILLSITWLTKIARQLYAKHWRKTHMKAAAYGDETTKMIGVLQNIQTLYSSTQPTSVSLADIEALLQSLQQNHGQQATLEAVIQQLTGQQLRLQLRRRQARHIQQKALVVA